MKQQDHNLCPRNSMKLQLSIKQWSVLIFNSHGHLNSKTFANAENTNYIASSSEPKQN